MKKILAATVGMIAFVAFAFQTPAQDLEPNEELVDSSLEITWEGIEDGQALAESDDFVVETE